MRTAESVPDQQAGGGVPDPRRWLILFLMSLGTLIVFLDLTVVNTALPAISLDLQASTADLQWVVDGYVLALAGLLLLAGSIGDRYGRRRWMTAGLVIFAAGSAVGATADSIGVLVGGRALMGLGAAFLLPATLSIVTNTFERAERTRAIAVWTAVGGMGIGLGPAVGGWLVDRWDWSAAFWIHMPIIAISLLGQFVVRESRDPRDIGLDVPGAITATLGLTALVFGVIEGAEAGWTSTEVLGAFGVAAVLLGAFVAIERRVQYPMLPLGFFRDRNFTGSVVIIAMLFFAAPAAFFFLTQFFQIIQGRDPFEAGLLILPNAGAIVLATVLSPRLGRRFGPRWTLVLGSLIMASAFVAFTTFDLVTTTSAAIVAIAWLGFGFGLGMPILTDTVMASVPVEDAGIGSAINDVSRELGSALGVAVIGSFISGIYRADVAERLADGGLTGNVVEAAREGLGALAAQAATLAGADRAMGIAADTFVDAMTAGFWLSVVIMVAAAGVAALLLPDEVRDDQARREADSIHAGSALGFGTVPELAPQQA